VTALIAAILEPFRAALEAGLVEDLQLMKPRQGG